MPTAFLLMLLAGGVSKSASSAPQKAVPAAVDVDSDGDGWTPAQGDCCDTLAGCPNPALVNPGAFEVAANGVDDNCNGAIDEARPVCDVSLPSNPADPLMFAQAIDLCQTTIEAPTIDQRKWGVITAQFLLADGTGTPSALSRSIRQAFGSTNGPAFGVGMSVLSTGNAAAPGQTNPPYASFQGGQIIGTQSGFPADWFTANGNGLPNAPGCPSPTGTVAKDPVMLKLRVRVPTNARSFSVSTRFFTAEYPEWVCSPYNDFYVVLLDSMFAGSPANPSDKNLAAYTTGTGVYPIGSNLAYGNTGLFIACKNGSTGCASGSTAGTTSACTGTTDLAGTGFDVANPAGVSPGIPGYCGTNNLLGGGTAWLTVGGNVVPGETIELRFALWDTSDAYYDSVVLLDDFQWSTQLTTPGAFITGQVPVPFEPAAPTGVAATAQSQTSVAVVWNAAPSATSYQVFRRDPGGAFAQVAGVTSPTFTDTTVTPNTSYLYRVRALNDVGPSPESSADIATTVAFSSDPLAAGVTTVQAAHLSQLRTGVNAVRQLAGLPASVFTDSPSPGLLVKAVHVTELRSALNEALTQLALSSGGYTDPIVPGLDVRAVHWQEIRDRIK